MHEGYTLVWVGWEFDVPATALRLAAPPIEARSILVRFYGRGDMMPGASKPGRS